MAVDLMAVTIALDGIFLIALAIQVLVCVYVLVRSGPSLPSQTAIFVLLGGLALQLANYATTLSEDSRKTGVTFAREMNLQSFTFQLIEGLLATFGYIAVIASLLMMLHRSGKGTKSERWMRKVVVVGSCVMLVLLGLDIGSQAYSYMTNSWLLLRGLRESQDLLRASANTQRGISITVLLMDVALIIVLALGGYANPVNQLHNAIFCGLIPAILVQITLSAIGMGLYYSEQHMDVLIDVAYIYTMHALSETTSIIIPACVLYVGYSWTATDLSYTATSFVKASQKSSSQSSVSSVEEIVRKA